MAKSCEHLHDLTAADFPSPRTPGACEECLQEGTRWSCRTGVCHTCECGLVSGSVAYDPEPLEPPADGNLLTCCSRPREDLVIDI